jgi:glycerophosphoryl diester phosphodiesterase
MAYLDWLIARPAAHRGLHDAAAGVIENTSSAFAAAVAANYAIECDLQITADGEAMVYHDSTLGRLTEGTARLDAMTTSALKQVPFRATSDRMITVGDLCDLVAGRVTLVIELKSHFDGDRRLAARVAAVLLRYHGPAGVMSFDPGLIAAVRAIAPALVGGLVAESGTGGHKLGTYGQKARRAVDYVGQLRRARPQFIAYSVKDLPAPLPLAAKRLLHLPVLAWTVRTEEDRRRAARWADQMIFEGFRP